MVHQDLDSLETAAEQHKELEQAARHGYGWSSHAVDKEWHQFSIAWNEIVFSLRTRDMISNAERDDLQFEVLEGHWFRHLGHR